MTLLGILLFNIFFGFFICFYGEKIISFLVSISLVLIAGFYFYNKFGYSQKNLIIFIVFAILLFVAFKFFVKFGLFLIGGAIGTILGFVLVTFFTSKLRGYENIVILFMAIAFGIIAAISQKKILIFLTALGGANMIGSSLIFLIFNIKNIMFLTKRLDYRSVSKVLKIFENRTSLNSWMILGAVVIFTIMGYLFQNKKLIK